ncbi:MAG: hypothetical protein ACPGUD_11195 [Parashewanella sp.]
MSAATFSLSSFSSMYPTWNSTMPVDCEKQKIKDSLHSKYMCRQLHGSCPTIVRGALAATQLLDDVYFSGSACTGQPKFSSNPKVTGSQTKPNVTSKATSDCMGIKQVHTKTKFEVIPFEEALVSDTYQSLIRHAQRHEALTQHLRSLYEATSTREDFNHFKTAVKEENWQHPLLFNVEAENYAILLYITNEITPDEYLNLAIIIASYQQFITCIPHSLPTTKKYGLNLPVETITADNFYRFFIPCISCEIKNLSLPENAYFMDSFVRAHQKQKEEVECRVGSVKNLIRNNRQKFEVICVKLSQEVLPYIFPEGNTGLGTEKIHGWILQLITGAEGVCLYDSVEQLLFIPTFKAMKCFFEAQPWYVQAIPVLGETSADEMKTYRWKNQHPIPLHNSIISNNFEMAHGTFTGFVFAPLHDLTHVSQQNNTSEKNRDINLHIDSALLKLGKQQHEQLRISYWNRRIEHILNLLLNNLSFDEFSSPLKQCIVEYQKLSTAESQDDYLSIPPRVREYATNDEYRYFLDQANAKCEGFVISSSFELNFMRIFIWDTHEGAENLIVFCHLCLYLEEYCPEKLDQFEKILYQIKQKYTSSAYYYSPYFKTIALHIQLLELFKETSVS